MYKFSMGILEGGLLQSWKSKPISSFGNLMVENDKRSALKMTKEMHYSLNIFSFYFWYCQSHPSQNSKKYLANPTSKFWYVV